MVEQLRAEIRTVQHHLVLAEQDGLDYEAHLHRAHLTTLFEAAVRRGIDVTAEFERSGAPPDPTRPELL